MSVGSHSIDVVIKNILNKAWETLPDGTVVREVPAATPEEECVVSAAFLACSCSRAYILMDQLLPQDCFDWEFGHFKQPNTISEQSQHRRE